jgi:hypothetical protein
MYLVNYEFMSSLMYNQCNFIGIPDPDVYKIRFLVLTFTHNKF